MIRSQSATLDKRVSSTIDRSALLIRYGGLIVSLATLLVGVIWAFAIKPFDAPDEPMHLQAVMQILKGHGLPEVHYDMSIGPKGSIVNTYIDQPTWDYAVSQGTTSSYRLEPNQSIQPPLYYGIVALAASFTSADPAVVLYIGRLVSVLLGVAVVFLCWATIRELFPTEPGLALLVSGMVSLLPQFSFLRATLNNDNAVILAGVASFYLWVKALRHPEYDPWMWQAGAVAGLGMLSKLTATSLLPALALVILFRAFQLTSNTKRLATNSRLLWRERISRGVRMSVGAGGAFLLVYGWFMVRNLLVYGDIIGLGNAAAYNGARLPLYDMSDPGIQTLFINQTWESFIGGFGWLDIFYPPVIYNIISILFTLMAVMTFFVTAQTLIRFIQMRRINTNPVDPDKLAGRIISTYVWQILAVTVLVASAVIFNYVNYSLTRNFQAQARHTFLLLLPYGLFFTWGLYVLMKGRQTASLVTSLPLVILATLNAAGIFLVANINN